MSLQRNYADFFPRNYLNLSPQILDGLNPVVIPIVNHMRRCGDNFTPFIQKKLIPLKIFLSRGLVTQTSKKSINNVPSFYHT